MTISVFFYENVCIKEMAINANKVMHPDYNTAVAKVHARKSLYERKEAVVTDSGEEFQWEIVLDTNIISACKWLMQSVLGVTVRSSCCMHYYIRREVGQVVHIFVHNLSYCIVIAL